MTGTPEQLQANGGEEVRSGDESGSTAAAAAEPAEVQATAGDSPSASEAQVPNEEITAEAEPKPQGAAQETAPAAPAAPSPPVLPSGPGPSLPNPEFDLAALEAVAPAAIAAKPVPQPAVAGAEVADAPPETPSEDFPPAAALESGAPILPGLPQEGVSDEEIEGEDVPYEPQLTEFVIGPAQFREGDRREGVVVSVSSDGVVVDIGGKTEGFLSNREGDERLAALQPGAEVVVYVTRLGEPGEYLRLGLAHEENSQAWDALEAAFEAKQPVAASVLERVKGGLKVDVGVPAFLPGSHVGHGPADNLDDLIGQEFPVAIVKLSRRRGNVVVSRRQLVDEELRAQRLETLSKLELGGEATGEVKNVTSYGAFVDLGGLDALIHVTDISYGRIKDPSEALTPGQQITAKVIKLDLEKERVSLSLKDMTPDPWANVEERYKKGDRVRGQVASLTDYGAFIELEPGVEGLIHITEMTWSKRLKHPSKALAEGAETEAVVLKVQPEKRRISLSLRQLAPDPWEGIEQRYRIGDVVEGRVRNLTSYGAFVELVEGIDGLVHVSDLSWETRVNTPSDVVRKGQEIRAVVLNIDAGGRRLSLGIKQLEPDVWEKFASSYGAGDVLEGKVTRRAKFGVFVELAPGVEGLCHNSEIPPPGKGGRPALQPGRSYRFEILKLDEYNKRIALRCVDPKPIATAPPKKAKAKPKAPAVEAVEKQPEGQSMAQETAGEAASATAEGPSEAAEVDGAVDGDDAEKQAEAESVAQEKAGDAASATTEGPSEAVKVDEPAGEGGGDIENSGKSQPAGEGPTNAGE